MTTEILHISSITAYHKLKGLKSPLHPLLSIVDFNDMQQEYKSTGKMTFGFYCVALKDLINGAMKYGLQEYDFKDGVLAFLAPHQNMSVEVNDGSQLKHKGKMLLMHPDFIYKTGLASKMKSYDFFEYHLNEALHLSDREQQLINDLLNQIELELQNNIDSHSHNVIISQIDLLLTYSARFYERQFHTRRKVHHDVLEKFEILLRESFENKLLNPGIPTVKQIADDLNLSPNYLSRLLKTLTNKSTQEHIHETIISRAKLQLANTPLSVSEISYALGFEHPQSFGKLFKRKTEMTPLEYRQSFN
ncbi:helix-turn-helix domain-containing protein [Nonlabens ponticola]|nr:helix-turn-helix transcriptional regulator [Nonlabens ponticola]